MCRSIIDFKDILNPAKPKVWKAAWFLPCRVVITCYSVVHPLGIRLWFTVPRWSSARLDFRYSDTLCCSPPDGHRCAIPLPPLRFLIGGISRMFGGFAWLSDTSSFCAFTWSTCFLLRASLFFYLQAFPRANSAGRDSIVSTSYTGIAPFRLVWLCWTFSLDPIEVYHTLQYSVKYFFVIFGKKFSEFYFELFARFSFLSLDSCWNSW